jgi:hypothetical protein
MHGWNVEVIAFHYEVCMLQCAGRSSTREAEQVKAILCYSHDTSDMKEAKLGGKLCGFDSFSIRATATI